MTDDEAIALALTHYRAKSETWLTAWTGRDASGTTWAGAIVTEWQAEYDIIAALGLDETTVQSTSFEGGQVSALANFSPAIRLRALQLFRAELQPAYAPVITTPPTIRKRRRAGHVIRFSPC